MPTVETWREMKIEGVEFCPETMKVRLSLTSGPYRGEYGQFREDRTVVILNAEEK